MMRVALRRRWISWRIQFSVEGTSTEQVGIRVLVRVESTASVPRWWQIDTQSLTTARKLSLLGCGSIYSTNWSK